MSKQTAVQYLAEKISDEIKKGTDIQKLAGNILIEVIRAEAMEREQIEEAYAQGDEDYYNAERGLPSFDDSVDYYHQTYEKGETE